MNMGLRFRLLHVVWLLGATNAQQFIDEEPSGILVVGGVQVNVDIPTRVGCRELLRCMGNGSANSLEWRRFSLRGRLEEDEVRTIDIKMTDLDMDNIFSFISHLEFDPIRLIDSGSFTCTIDSQGTHTARLRVEPELAEVNATDHDISTRNVGESMSIFCTVDSCVPDLTVQLLRGDEVKATRLRSQGSGINFMPEEDSFELTVNEDIVGQYSCRVVGTFMGETFVVSEFFNITGNPLPPTTAMPMPTRSSGGGGGGGGTRGSAGMLRMSLAVVLLALLLPFILL